MKDWVIQFFCSIGVLVALALAYHLGPAAHVPAALRISNSWVPHAATGAILLALIVLTALVGPFHSIAAYVFTPLTTTLAGTVFPIYESVRAVCTPLEDDDKAWLQYWMVGGVLFMCTGWIGHVMTDACIWYEICTIFFVWLFLPVCSGARLIYIHITEPFISPHVKPLVGKMNNALIALYQMMMNAVHLWLVWIIFLFLPSGLKRIIAVVIGTVYPLICSITAASTEEVADDTYWLTYWSVYGCLFLLMELLETWLGKIPGFYTLVIVATVYLMLPMFQGADKLFRKVLVPLARLQEMLLLRDAIQVKKQMLKDLPHERAVAVRQAIAQFYADDNATTIDPAEVPGSAKKEYLTAWGNINPFRRTDTGEGEPSETTPIV